MLNLDALSSANGQLPRGTPGKRAYAIGDIHGCYDLLLNLLEKIQKHADSRTDLDTHIVFVGDLIDRGPQSREVVDSLRDYKSDFATLHFIKGNHEEVLVRICEGDSSQVNMWLAHGGWQTIQSYGASSSDFRGLSPEESAAMLKSIIPQEHIDFFKSFDDGIQFGDYFITHAGIRPGIPLNAQSGRDLRWIREGFLDSNDNFGAVIVHGHTISDDVLIKPNRIGIDTGAYISGKLSALWIEENELGVLETHRDELAAETTAA